MADWQEQLNTILSDPDAMAQIAALAQSIGGGAPEQAQQGASADAAPDAELLGRLAPLMGQLRSSGSGEAAALLRALRPYLSEKRRDKVERAAQLARLIHLGKAFLLSAEREDGRV